MSARSAALAVAAAVVAVACAAGLPQPTSEDAERARTSYSDVSLEQLARGRELYVRSCAGCHTLKPPSELPTSRWRGAVDEMRQKKGARLSDEESEAIVRYLETVSQR
ncbi:MAG TPA: cytochrome c [Polyangiaceae bacterium]|nr:cytochrome c [Polyangiaceae bacterium]